MADHTLNASESAVQFMYLIVFVLSRFMRSAFMGYIKGYAPGALGASVPGRARKFRRTVVHDAAQRLCQDPGGWIQACQNSLPYQPFPVASQLNVFKGIPKTGS